MKKVLSVLLIPSILASSTCLFTNAARGNKPGKNNDNSNAKNYAPRQTEGNAIRNRFRHLPQNAVIFLNELPQVTKAADIRNLPQEERAPLREIRRSNLVRTEFLNTMEHISNQLGELAEDVAAINRGFANFNPFTSSEDQLDLFFNLLMTTLMTNAQNTNEAEATVEMFNGIYRNLNSVEEKRNFILSMSHLGYTILNDYIFGDGSSSEDSVADRE